MANPKMTVAEMYEAEIATAAWRRSSWTPENGYLALATIGGEEVIDSADIGDYQGDCLALLRDPETGLYAFVEWGYGSCSGCDTLQGAEGNLPEIQAIADDLHPMGEAWKSAPDMLTWFMDRDWAAHYYGKDTECVQFVARVISTLRDATIAGL